MTRQRSQTLVAGAVFLSLAGLLAKVLGAGYRVVLQNAAGDEAVYVYQQVYPFLAFALMLSLYGYPSALALLARDRQTMSRSFIYRSLAVIYLFSTVIGLGLYFGAPLLAQFIGDTTLVGTYRWSALIFFIVPILALLRGLYQGQSFMVPVALSQVTEQFIRVCLIITGALLVFKQWMDLSTIGYVAVFASIVGAFGGLFVLFLYRKQLVTINDKQPVLPWRTFFVTIGMVGFAATLNHAVLIFMQMVDALLVLPQLLASGLTLPVAMIEKGIFDRGQPLIQIGSVVGSSFALAVLPFIAKAKREKNEAALYASIQTALKCSFTLALGATIGLIGLFPLLNIVLFKNTLGTNVLQVYMLVVLCSSLLMTGIAILQGLNQVRKTARFIVYSICLKFGLTYVFVPLWGTLGSALATVFSLGLLVWIVLQSIRQHLGVNRLFGDRRIWFVFLYSAGFLVLITYCFRQLGLLLAIESRFFLLVYVVLVAFIGALGYLGLLIRGRLFSKEELRTLPFSKILKRFYKK